MESTPKVITIIGLVLEGISVITLGISGLFMARISELPGLGSATEAEMTIEEYVEFIQVMEWIGNLLFVMAIVITIFFTINLILFIGLMKEKYTEEQAKKIYLYQAIWGGLNLLSNQITGILYLISGVQGYNGRKDSVDVREGI